MEKGMKKMNSTSFVFIFMFSATVFGVSTESMQLSYDTRGNSVPTILLLMQRHLYALGGLQVYHLDLSFSALLLVTFSHGVELNNWTQFRKCQKEKWHSCFIIHHSIQIWSLLHFKYDYLYAPAWLNSWILEFIHAGRGDFQN